MRINRQLELNVWYEVRTAINIAEPLFRLPWAKVLLYRVLLETMALFGFEMRGFKLDGAWLTFYIKPADGLQLPKIMQWLKQTFSVRFNRLTGRSGHVWGDRYWSAILAEEPPEEAEEADWESLEIWAQLPPPEAGTYTLTWDSPQRPGLTITTVVSVRNAPETPPPTA